MEQALGAHGKMHKGVLTVSVGRKNIGRVKGPMNVEFTSAFELHHTFYIQTIGLGHAMVNGEVALNPEETDPVIKAIVEHGLVFQAQHQRFMGEDPQLWHIHFRGTGEPVDLMKRLHSVMQKTGTPLPQKSAESPSSPLAHRKLGQIIGGHAEVHEDGVISVAVPRKQRIRLGGTKVNPMLGVMSHISFRPIQTNARSVRNGQGTSGSGSQEGKMQAATAPDFALTANEVDAVMKIMLNRGSQGHCLYNQETDEHPQLYFSHQLNAGDPEQLAHSIRQALEKMDVEFS